MLSYRHSFHAGNFADVLKHVVLIEIISHLQKKTVGFDYVDTHSGAGLYDLQQGHSEKLHEYRGGIARLVNLEWPELEKYLSLVAKFNQPGKLHKYPGSPLFALSMLRPQDRAWLYELHPTDFQLLSRNTGRGKKIRVSKEDGFKALPGLLPPASRRGVVLIDPSYEVKSDYSTVVKVLQQAHKRFSTGTYCLWYPVVDRRQIDRLERDLKAAAIRNIQRFELGVTSDEEAQGMTSSGMIVINPTWGLFEKMSALLPRLAKKLGSKEPGPFRCDTLSPE